MTVYDKLLEKSKLFEKLALYSKRSDFLNKISQMTTWEINPSVIRFAINEITGKAQQLQQESGFREESKPIFQHNLDILLQDPDVKSLNITGMDKAIKAAGQLAYMINDKDLNFIVGNFQRLVSKYKQTVNETTSLIPNQPDNITAHETVIEGNPPQHHKSQTPGLADVQTKLNQLGAKNKAGRPIAVDGILGPETQGAINWFKSTNNLPSNWSNELTFEAIRRA